MSAGPLPASVLLAAAAHAEACWPEEACGVVLLRPAGAGFVPLRNASERPRASYRIAPEDLLRVAREAEHFGDRIACIVHSHPASGPEFSSEDEQMALDGAGAPLWPGVQYLIIAAPGGSAGKALLHTWDGGEGRYKAQEIQIFAGIG